VTCF